MLNGQKLTKGYLSGNSIAMAPLLSGNDDTETGNCTAEFLEGTLDTMSSGRSARRIGRPEYIKDSTLRGNRNRLLSVFEASWDHAGWAFNKIRKPAHVREALGVLEPERETFLVELLLRPTASRMSMKELRKTNRDWIDLGESIRIASDELFRRQKLVERAKEALAITSNTDRDRISAILAECDAALARAHETYASKISERKALEDKVKDGFAYFARTEVADFCSKKRYIRNPFNTANALAGLPYIGWRQSMKRCLDWKLDDLGSGRQSVIETMASIVKSCGSRTKLIDRTEQRLRDRLTGNSRVISDLAENWYYLRESLKRTSREKGISTKELPYRIAQIYYRMKMNPSPADIVLAEEMRIVL